MTRFILEFPIINDGMPFTLHFEIVGSDVSQHKFHNLCDKVLQEMRPAHSKESLNWFGVLTENSKGTTVRFPYKWANSGNMIENINWNFEVKDLAGFLFYWSYIFYMNGMRKINDAAIFSMMESLKLEYREDLHFLVTTN